MKTDKLNWSQIFRDLRKEAGMTQKELAYKINMPQRTIAEYENVNRFRHLSIHRIEIILEIFGYELDVFLRSR